MDCTLKRPAYFPFLGFMMAVALLLPSCALWPTTNKAPERIEWQDGTVSEPGDSMYQYVDGRGTANATDPETGKPNQPLPVDDVEKAEKAGAAVEKFTGNLPPPFGWLAGLGVLGVTAGGVAVMRRRREKQIAGAGGKKAKA